MKNSVDCYLFYFFLGGNTANEPHSLKTSNNAENCIVAQQRSTGSLHSFNYHNSAPFSHIHVQRAKWPIKKTNSISEVLGACLCLRSPLHCHIEHSVGQLNDAWREAGRGASYSQQVNSPIGIEYNHTCVCVCVCVLISQHLQEFVRAKSNTHTRALLFPK